MSLSRLPPLGALEAFVAVAQRRSLKAAAPDLGVSVSALSRRIQTLETQLDLVLFERGARELRLTADGAALLESVCAAFDTLWSSIAALKPTAQRFALRVGAPAGLAGYWLAPRVAGFRALEPLVDVAIDTGNLSLSRLGSGLHALIVVMDGQGVVSTDRHLVQALAPLRVRAVCSPGFLAQAGGGLTPEDLERFTVLAPREHGDWLGHWLRAAGGTGLRAARMDHFESTPVLLEAAASGLGVAILSELMADPHIKAGRLVDPFAIRADTASRYALIVRPQEAELEPVKRFQAWMAQAFTDEPRPQIFKPQPRSQIVVEPVFRFGDL